MDIQSTLIGLGLSPKEIAIYTSLLEIGEATVAQAAKKSGIKRPTAYVILQTLEEKGFVSGTKRGKKISYIPQHPRKLLTEAELRVSELTEVMPQLESLLHTGEGRPRVVIYEGKEKLDRAYDESFVIKGEILYICTLDLYAQAFPRTFKKFFHYTKRFPDFRVREIIDESEHTATYADKYRGHYHQIKFIPKRLLPFEMDIGIFGNTTLITSLKHEYFTVSIESKEIANAFRVMFEMMWMSAKE